MKKKYYIGELPPPYGGVTVKNSLLYEELKKIHNIKMIDLMECKRTPYKIPLTFFRILMVFMSKATVIYGMGSYKRLKTLLFCQSLFGKSIEKVTIIVMGGTFAQSVLKDKKMQTFCKQVKCIWVETECMSKQLNVLFHEDNLKVFPNPKTGVGACPPRIRSKQEPLKLVFFSQISKEKGVEDIIAAIQQLNTQTDIIYELDFYGHIKDNIRKKFEIFIKDNKTVSYKGVFDSTQANIYQKLNEYDILLFPSHWKGEGVPGILVEAKMAGLAIIASNKNYNCEIVREVDKEGIILKDDYAVEIVETILNFYYNPETLQDIKESSYYSRKRYTIEEYRGILYSI